MLTRRLLTVALAATVVAVPGALASPKATVQAGPLSPAADVAAMVDLETKMTDQLQQGHAVPVDFRTADQAPGDVVATGSWGDSGLWTGVYLGGESLRYATAKAHLASLLGPSAGKGNADNAAGHNSDEVTFWKAQRDQAMSRMRTILAAEHRDINIAEDWTGSLQVPPNVNTQNPTGTHTADFGGGVIHGQRGMIMRACTPKGLGPMGVNPPTVDAAHPVNNNNNRVFEITWTLELTRSRGHHVIADRWRVAGRTAVRPG